MGALIVTRLILVIGYMMYMIQYVSIRRGRWPLALNATLKVTKKMIQYVEWQISIYLMRYIFVKFKQKKKKRNNFIRLSTYLPGGMR